MRFFLKLILFLVTLDSYSQYSTYYVNQNIKQNIKHDINVNNNVSGSVTINKNISTIDYGQLAMANVQFEMLKLERIKYANEKEKSILIQIAKDPIKAFDYGYNDSWSYSGQEAKKYNFRRFTMGYKIPHQSLFVGAGPGRYQNVSTDGITTEIQFLPPLGINKKIGTEINVTYDLEDVLKEQIAKINVGKVNSIMGRNAFVHMVDLNKATVFGVRGFKNTFIIEDDYELIITDYFRSINKEQEGAISHSVTVKTYGDKDEVTFENLEGRRFYLRNLIEKIIATAYLTNVKLL